MRTPQGSPTKQPPNCAESEPIWEPTRQRAVSFPPLKLSIGVTDWPGAACALQVSRHVVFGSISTQLIAFGIVGTGVGEGGGLGAAVGAAAGASDGDTLISFHFGNLSLGEASRKASLAVQKGFRRVLGHFVFICSRLKKTSAGKSQVVQLLLYRGPKKPKH